MPKAKIKAAMKRKFKNVWVCMRCNAKIRAKPEAVAAKKVKCRKCGYRGLRPKAKERKLGTKTA